MFTGKAFTSNVSIGNLPVGNVPVGNVPVGIVSVGIVPVGIVRDRIVLDGNVFGIDAFGVDAACVGDPRPSPDGANASVAAGVTNPLVVDDPPKVVAATTPCGAVVVALPCAR